MVDLTQHAVEPVKPDLTPLLDVVFILLIFFVVSAVFAARGMELELPEAESAKPVAGQSLEIAVATDGSLTINDQPIDLTGLADRLGSLAQAPPSRQPGRILLKAAPDAQVGPFVKLLDLVRINGFDNLVIATRNQPTGETAQ